uniref:Laminin G domain-containing protein n=1 Tax=Timema monikensis TaxID=170555 RepID=A0A7R9HJG9_9NEOP|nr:unnamed protein product [Timema monikensis]
MFAYRPRRFPPPLESPNTKPPAVTFHRDLLNNSNIERDDMDYLNLALKDGGVTLTMNLGNGKLEMSIKPNKVRFDDNQWHKVTVHRKVQELANALVVLSSTAEDGEIVAQISVRSCVQYWSLFQLSAVVDGVYSEHSHTAGTFTMLSSSRVYVGGSLNTHALPGSKIHSNFVGCLRKVRLTFLHFLH